MSCVVRALILLFIVSALLLNFYYRYDKKIVTMKAIAITMASVCVLCAVGAAHAVFFVLHSIAL